MTLKNTSFKPGKILAYIILFVILSSLNAPSFDVSGIDAKANSNLHINFNRKVLQTPTMDIYTSGYQKITVDCTNLLIDEKYNLTVRDRTADSTILSTNITTDSVGSFSYIIDQSSHSELQDQREIAVNATAYSNSSSTIEEYYTPLLATDFLYYYEEGNEWDFSEETDDSWSGESGSQDGYLYDDVSAGGGTQYLKMSSYSIDTTKYDTVIIRVKTNDTESNILKLYNSSTNQLGSTQTITNSWSIITIDVGSDSDWTGTITDLRIYWYDNGYSTFEGDERLHLDLVRIAKRDTPVITKAVDYCYATSENNTFKYRVYSEDNVLRGEYLDGEDVPLLTGNHTYTFITYRDTARALVFLPAANVTFNYLRETKNITTIWTPFGKAEDIAKGLYNHLPQLAVMSVFAIVVILFIKKNRRR